ncbi:complex 1 protein LYR family protein [Pyrenophora tritici-repentis]|nr:complex 1 protein LYR family protein [Pyrenophora tritici-repentis]
MPASRKSKAERRTIAFPAQFHKHKDVGKKDFGTIEYLLRRGRNQLESWSDPGIRDIHK